MKEATAVEAPVEEAHVEERAWRSLRGRACVEERAWRSVCGGAYVEEAHKWRRYTWGSFTCG